MNKRPLNETPKEDDVVDKTVTTIVRKTEKAVNFAHPEGTKSVTFACPFGVISMETNDKNSNLHRLFPFETCA